MTRFVVVPQWQGSPSARAMQLIDGAHAIAGDLPRVATTVLEVPMGAGDALDTGVHRFSMLQGLRELLDENLAEGDEPVLIVGGDCGVSVGGIARCARETESLAVVWCDAHPDLHTPESSPSGAFAGMALRAVLGEGAPSLALAADTVPPARVVLAGARSFDDAEEEYASSTRIEQLAAADLSTPGSLEHAVAATGATAVYVHIDLDVLDPAEIAGVGSAQPFGVAAADLIARLGELRRTVPLAGAAITGFSPQSPAAAVDDLGTILRLVGALA